jgi:hypothetical protein
VSEVVKGAKVCSMEKYLLSKERFFSWPLFWTS